MDQKASKHEQELRAIRDLLESAGWKHLKLRMLNVVEALTQDLIHNEYPPNKSADAVRAEIRALNSLIFEPDTYLEEIEYLKKTDKGTD